MKKTTYNEEFIMEHKLIVENWRKYLTEIGPQSVGPGSYQAGIDQDFKEAEKKAIRSVAKNVLLMLEPTGLVGDIDTQTGEVTGTLTMMSRDQELLKKSLKSGDYKNSALYAGSVVLAALSLMPIAGKGFKIAKMKGLDKLAKATSKKLKNTNSPEAIELAEKIRSQIKVSYFPNGTPKVPKYLSDLLDELDIHVDRVYDLGEKWTKTAEKHVDLDHPLVMAAEERFDKAMDLVMDDLMDTILDLTPGYIKRYSKTAADAERVEYLGYLKTRTFDELGYSGERLEDTIDRLFSIRRKMDSLAKDL